MRRRPTKHAIVAAALLPMLVAALVLWSLGDRVDRIDTVPAAVVNLDEPVERGTGKDKEVIAAGRLLAAGLTSPEDGEAGHEGTEPALDWQLTTPEDARAGLREGRYHAVVTIPAGFSRTVAGLDGAEPSRATLSVRSSDSSSPAVGLVGERLAEVAADRLGQRVTATYLEGIYARTGTLSRRLGRAEDGAARIADGAGRLGEGTAALGAGAGSLADGVGDLAGGAEQLRVGAARLAEGAAELAEGTSRLRSGSSELDEGAGRLEAGLGELLQRTRPLPDRTDRLADGAGQVAEGVDGWSQVLLAWKQACTRDPVLAGSKPQLCAATIRAVGANGQNADAMVSGSQQVAQGARALADAAPDLVAGIEEARTGAGRLAEGTSRLAVGARTLDRGAERLAGGAGRLDDGAGELADGASRAREGATRLAGGTDELADGTRELGSGSRQLRDRLGEGRKRIPTYSPDTRQQLARVVAEPVRATSQRLNQVPSGATGLAPAVLAVALWLGALATYLVRRGLPERVLHRASSPARVALAGWLPAVLTGVVQSVLLFVAALLLGVEMASPWGVLVLLLVASAAFAALNQALVAALGPGRGAIGSLVLAVLQVAALGVVLPVESAPAPMRPLHALLPVDVTAEGLGRLVLGGQAGSVPVAVVMLVLWTVLALVVTALAARRQQQVTVSDVRRSVLASAR